MRPPRGFEAEKFPLRHRLVHQFQLGLGSDSRNTAYIPLVRFASGTNAGITNPDTIQVNPHNSAFEQDAGPLCAKMSIIDRLRISMKFVMTANTDTAHMSGGTFGANGQTAGTFTGDSIQVIKLLWRPIFGVFPEKWDATDDDTTLSVSAILGMTKDATNEDIVPVTTTNLPADGPLTPTLPNSTVNSVEIFSDYNMTTDFLMEDHVHDEDVLQDHLKRGTNKGALRSCIGRTRHVTISKVRPFHNVYIDKPVPRAIRRIQPFAIFGIQIHVPIMTDVEQAFLSKTPSTTTGHVGVKMITNYHEWNSEHDQDRGTPT